MSAPDNLPGASWAISAQRETRYSVRLERLLLDNGSASELGTHGTRRIVFVDSKVHDLYGDRIAAYFRRNGVTATIFQIPCTESAKNLKTLESVLSELDRFQLLRRSEPIIAIGGGVLLDVVGLAASLHRRGVPYVRVPTTLLAAVDVSVAAKTGINFGGFRNRLGAYYPPSVALIDPSFLQSLEVRQIRSGMAEIIKIALIADRILFDALEKYGPALIDDKFQNVHAEGVIGRAVSAMLAQLESNLWEENLERLADFGHTFSPALEMIAAGELTHGEAVILDVQLSCLLANAQGLLDAAALERIQTMIATTGLPMSHPLFMDPQRILTALDETALHRDGRRILPVPTGIGRGVIVEVNSPDEIVAVVLRFAAGAAR